MIYNPANQLLYAYANNEDDEREGLCSFNFRNGSATLISEDWLGSFEDSVDPIMNSRAGSGENLGISIGIINGKLHGIKRAGDKKLSLVEIADNGSEKVIKTVTCNQTISEEPYSSLMFEYNAAENIIYFPVVIETDSDDDGICFVPGI